ncbi:hypothetical protein WA026_007716 [Henosepilachna vigintioctopunctata]|uniref:Uncharacterized protein n=1 Tax=Henosepilachna vigintioctopunctata TaxID=420089 RepID=A0AAW1TYI2_9CUCU
MHSQDKQPSNREREAPPSPHYLPDLPLPTPPPMANIMMTSRFDLQTRGGCGYRRILSSRSTTDFSPGRSPIFPRSSTFQRDKPGFGAFRDRSLSLSPFPIRRVVSEESPKPSLEPPPKQMSSRTVKSKYLSRSSVIMEELEEVEKLRKEIQQKLNQSKPLEISPEYQCVYFNEHYMSDIDENEEIKEFSVGYKTPDTDISDDMFPPQNYMNRKPFDINYTLSTDLDYEDVFDSGVFMKYYNLDSVYPQVNNMTIENVRKFQTISSSDLRGELKKPRKKCSKRNSLHEYEYCGVPVTVPNWKNVRSNSRGSLSGIDRKSASYKSLNCYSDSADSISREFSDSCLKSVTKSPYRPVVKLANIRSVTITKTSTFFQCS